MPFFAFNFDSETKKEHNFCYFYINFVLVFVNLNGE